MFLCCECKSAPFWPTICPYPPLFASLLRGFIISLEISMFLYQVLVHYELIGIMIRVFKGVLNLMSLPSA